VNTEYDAGKIIFQTKCNVSPDDTPESLAVKVHSLEYEHYPRVIEELVRKAGGQRGSQGESESGCN
jgi:phosphoribosylglycinamide formyltransferase-1